MGESVCVWWGVCVVYGGECVNGEKSACVGCMGGVCVHVWGRVCAVVCSCVYVGEGRRECVYEGGGDYSSNL